MQRKFMLAEKDMFGSEYSWRLKESQIRFRGTGDFAHLVTRRIPAEESQIDAFFSALDFLQVWEWRDDYNPNDLGFQVIDGSEWSFTVCDGRREYRCGGANAYPSYADVKISTDEHGRFGLLRAALYDCFRIEYYIREAKKIAEVVKENNLESDDADV